ncbi:MAG: hypothetical protein GX235_07965 [Clostridiales bacterium]|nr:hypothetical protein [Clostridiales bacterium]
MENRIKNKVIKRRRYFCVLLILSSFLLCAGACSSKETVLLEAEELVYEEQGEGDKEAVAEEAEEQVEKTHLFVHICGAVQKPGVYELETGSRMFEAVEAAGGFREDACENYVNMALPLQDGWKIVIPTIEEGEAMLMQDGKGDGNPPSGIVSESAGISGKETDTDQEQGILVNINTATKKELCSLPGIGESRAASIIAYRENNSPFSKPEDIMKIEGIKEGMFLKLKDKICVK